METEKKRDLLLPASILIAALLVSVSLIYNAGRTEDSGAANLAGANNDQGTNPPSLDNVRSVGADDHIFGNPQAPIKIVEYSDLECPFCKSFHLTMKQVVADYDGQVAWVYRHFPLDTIHPKARKEAEAAECAAELGGNDAFWAYVDRVFEVTPSNNGLDLNLLPQIAGDIGLDVSKFENCLASGKYAAHIDEDLGNAVDSGGRGTPYSVLVAENGRVTPISGAQPLQNVKAIVDEALSR